MQKSLKKEHYLWQLLNIEKDIDKITEDLDSEKRNREDVMHELEHFEAEAAKKKKEQAKYLKEIAHCERKMSERSIRLDKSVSLPSFFLFTFWSVQIGFAGIIYWSRLESMFVSSFY